MVEAPAAVSESALATQPASQQPVTKALSAQHNLDMQLKPQEDSQQIGSETIHTCKLQVGLQLMNACLLLPDSDILTQHICNRGYSRFQG